MARPVIGICTAVERARWSVWDQEAFLLARSYVRAIQAAGGLVVMIPPDPALQDDPDDALDLLDGLILAGGADIDPASYGAERHRETKHTVPERDALEIALARRALDRDVPLLGICRGMQLMNVARGGTLEQHLPDPDASEIPLARRALDRDVPLLGICRGMQLMNVARGGTLEQHLPDSHGHHDPRRALGSFDDADPDVRLDEGSLAHRVAGETVHATKSHHHQGIADLGEGFRISGWAVMDELPECLEDPQRRFALGVQWHPEADEASRFVAALVEEAERARAEREHAGGAAGRTGRDGRDARPVRDGAHVARAHAGIRR